MSTPSGNLQNFDLRVASKDLGDEAGPRLGTAPRREDGDRLARSDADPEQHVSVPKYEPRSVVSDILGPLDRLPGLHVGQRWEMQVVNPFTGQVESGAGGGDPSRRDPLGGEPRIDLRGGAEDASTLQMHTWVRPDGVILRQEVPFPFVRLVLERRGEDGDAASEPTDRPRPRRGGRPHDRGPGRDQAIRVQVRRRPARPAGPAGRAVRIPRAQRRGEDDDDQDDLRAARADLGDRAGRRLRGDEPGGPATARHTSPISPISTTS